MSHYPLDYDEDKELHERQARAANHSGFDADHDRKQRTAKLLAEIAVMENSVDPQAIVNSFGHRDTVANHLKNLRMELAGMEAAEGGRPDLKINGQPIDITKASLAERRSAESAATPSYELPTYHSTYLYSNTPGYSFNGPRASITLENLQPTEPTPVPTSEDFEGIV